MCAEIQRTIMFMNHEFWDFAEFKRENARLLSKHIIVIDKHTARHLVKERELL